MHSLEGAVEVEIVGQLQDLRRGLTSGGDLEARSAAVEGARDRIINLVDNFFHEKLTGMPEIDDYEDVGGS